MAFVVMPAECVVLHTHTLNLMATATLRQFKKIKQKKKHTENDEIAGVSQQGLARY